MKNKNILIEKKKKSKAIGIREVGVLMLAPPRKSSVTLNNLSKVWCPHLQILQCYVWT